MKENDRLNDEGSNVLVQTLELILIALGLAVLHGLGVGLLKPMVIGLFLFFPCAFAMNMVEFIRSRS